MRLKKQINFNVTRELQDKPSSRLFLEDLPMGCKKVLTPY